MAMMRSTDKMVVALLIIGVALIAVAFAAFSFYDPIQAAFHARQQQVTGVPVEWQFNIQHPFSDIGRQLYRFHNFLLGINIAICALVAGLVMAAIWLYRASRHSEPARTSHNTALEVAWTILPVIVLLVIGTWSFSLLRLTDFPPKSDVTLKATVNQWYWTYTYPDNGGIEFSSYIVPDDKLAPEQRSLRLMAVDQYAVLPVDAAVRILVTASDVIHSFGVQSLGFKKDGVPGRINETWTRIEREGTYYGSCYELCGRNHAFMPIGIEAVSRQRFDAWIADAKRRMSQGLPPSGHAPTDLATAQP
jgi:cytochrome c oxidase subunit II